MATTDNVLQFLRQQGFLPEIADIMPRALQILQAARQHFYEALSE